MTISDWIVLGILLLCVIGALLHIHKRRLKGECVSCDGCPDCGRCRHSKQKNVK